MNEAPRSFEATNELASLELEAGMIGALLHYPTLYAAIAPTLKASHFSDSFLAGMFAWIGEQHSQGAVGGHALELACLNAADETSRKTIVHCLARMIVPIEAPSTAGLLRSLAERRSLIQAAKQITEAAKAGGENLTAEALDLIVSTDEDSHRSQFTLAEALKAIEESPPRRLSTGSDELDRKLGGFQAGRLYVVGGRPGSGKTTVAMSLLLQAAKRGAGVAVFSLEMTAPELACRALADIAYSRDSIITYTEIERGSVPTYARPRLDAAKDWLANLGSVLNINDKAASTLAEIRLAVRAMKRNGPIDVVLVDHLGLIKPSGNYRGNKVAETGEVSAGLKALAKDLDVAVVAVCQLNREVEKRDVEKRKPTLADLRWAGEIEQDADVVVMVYRPAYYLDPSDDGYLDEKNKLQLLVRKNRSGATGTVKMFCDMAAAHVRDEWRQ